MAYINGNEILFSAKINQYGFAVDDLRGLIEGSITEIKIPEGTAKIRGYAFRACALSHITIPASVKSIGLQAFSAITTLKTITFEGKPDSIVSNALQNTSIEHIVCPWKEGEVSGAPWGATNATIVYTG